MDEFGLIRQYFSALTAPAADVPLGIGDDCALLQPPPGQQLAITSDTLIAGRHFPLETAPEDVGWKTLAVNLSDLAAMGAEARWFLLSLSLPAVEEVWLARFTAGLGALARQTGIALVGGDTTQGPLALTVTALGLLPPGKALRRDGARAGDLICVTGTLGDAALGLRLLQAGSVPAALRERLDRPMPRLKAGLALRDLATAAVDLSDGLAGDLGHILAASHLGGELDLAALPMSPAFAERASPAARAGLQLQGGDDYELCFCLPPERLEAARAAVPEAFTVIGRITPEPGLRLVMPSGERQPFDPVGYRHF